MSQWYKLEGHTPVPVPIARLDEIGGRMVAKTKAGPDVEVSTVFLALDHASSGQEPQLFETMVFGGALDQEQERYATWGAAEEGHRRWVERAKIADTASVSLAPQIKVEYECGKCHWVLRAELTIDPVAVTCPHCGTAYRILPNVKIEPVFDER